MDNYGCQALAVPRKGARNALSPFGPISFIFMQFSATFCQIIGWRTPSGKSWIRHWLVTFLLCKLKYSSFFPKFSVTLKYIFLFVFYSSLFRPSTGSALGLGEHITYAAMSSKFTRGGAELTSPLFARSIF